MFLDCSFSFSHMIFRHFSKRPVTYYKFYYSDTASGRRWNFINFCDYLLIQRERQKLLIVFKIESNFQFTFMNLYTRVYLNAQAHLKFYYLISSRSTPLNFSTNFKIFYYRFNFYKSANFEPSWWVCHLNSFHTFAHNNFSSSFFVFFCSTL